MEKTPIFYDPVRKRWKRTMRLLSCLAVAFMVLLGVFVVAMLRTETMPELMLPSQQVAYPVASPPQPLLHRKPRRGKAALPQRATPQPGLGDGTLGAFFVNWDPAAYYALRAHIRDIDVLFPEWLHAATADGKLVSVFNASAPYGRPDSNILDWARTENPELSIVPLVNNYDGKAWQGNATARLVADPAARARLAAQLVDWLHAGGYRGVILDFENLPSSAQPGYRSFTNQLHHTLAAAGIKMYMALPVADDDYDLGYYAAHCDEAVLMDYDQHWTGSAPGPIAAQDWFVNNLRQALLQVPREKLMVGMSNYAYDWPAKGIGKELSDQQALVVAEESGSAVRLDPDSLNPTLDYQDDAGQLHHIWMTDAVTVVNERRAAAALGVNQAALWRFGTGDDSLWAGLAKYGDDAQVAAALGHPPPGHEMDMEGQGDIFHIASEPQVGVRTLTFDPATNLIRGEHYLRYPNSYRIDQYGSIPKTVALSFDDGPDPRWTPQILRILKQAGVPGTFFVIGANAERYPEILRQMYADGDEIGNHTFLHPDSSAIGRLQLELEINSTQRLLESELGVKTLLFRPPYGVDSTPETADEVRPLAWAQDMGYVTVANSIDPHDWEGIYTPAQIASSVLDQLDDGEVVLLHDGGGERASTVAALPLIIQELRARGYRLVGASALMGKTRAEVMPPLSTHDRAMVVAAGIIFDLLRWLETSIIWIFLAGIALMTGRVLTVGALAAWQKFRPHRPLDPNFLPPLALVIPAYNEATVIVPTVEAALASDYPEFRVIVVDDGSTDATRAVLEQAFAQDPRVLVLHQPNRGKAAALNFGIAQVHEEAVVTIDADTSIAPDALAKLAPHLSDPAVGAVAGNAKVGNRINLVTWFQAGEYITSQNLERRALDALNCITVVPGAIGCWRTAIVRRLGGFNNQTAAEDADLTVSIRRLGFRIVYEDGACAFTEAPVTLKTLMQQRLRWSYGILQTVWKHRDAIGREGTLGRFGLPNILVFQLALPLLGPVTDFMLLFALGLEWFRYHSHPRTWTPESLERLLFFFAALMLVDMLGSVVAFALEHREQWSLVGSVLLQRIVYRHVMALVLFRTFKHALQGGEFHWGKLERTATVAPRPTEAPAIAEA